MIIISSGFRVPHRETCASCARHPTGDSSITVVQPRSCRQVCALLQLHHVACRCRRATCRRCLRSTALNVGATFRVRVYDWPLPQDEPVHYTEVPVHSGLLVSIAVTPDDNFLFTSGLDGSVFALIIKVVYLSRVSSRRTCWIHQPYFAENTFTAVTLDLRYVQQLNSLSEQRLPHLRLGLSFCVPYTRRISWNFAVMFLRYLPRGKRFSHFRIANKISCGFQIVRREIRCICGESGKSGKTGAS